METLGDGSGSEGESDKEREEEALEAAALLRDRLRLSVISIASSHAKTLGMTISEPVVACIADLAFKQAAHRNEHFMGLLRNFAQELKEKEPCMEKKRKKKASKNENKVQEP
ncbi:histone superfamily protein isoform X2 [Carex rostrata]